MWSTEDASMQANDIDLIFIPIAFANSYTVRFLLFVRTFNKPLYVINVVD